MGGSEGAADTFVLDSIADLRSMQLLLVYCCTFSHGKIETCHGDCDTVHCDMTLETVSLTVSEGLKETQINVLTIIEANPFPLLFSLGNKSPMFTAAYKTMCFRAKIK